MTDSQPASKRLSIGAGGVLPIKALTNTYTRWKVQARVVEKGQMSVFSRKQGTYGGSEGHVFSCVVIDKEGTQINMKFWNAMAQEWHPKLEKGKAYTFSKGRIQLANKRYSGTVSHDYEITFDREAEVVPIEDDAEASPAIPLTRVMQYQSLRAVNMSTRKLPFVTNVLVVVHSHQQLRETQGSKGETRKLRTVTVVDATEFALDVTLWGEEAEADEAKLQQHPVVAVHSLQIREWRGRAGSTLSTTELLWDFDATDEAKELRKWYDAHAHSATFEPMTNIAGENGASQSQPPQEVNVAEIGQTLQDVSDGNVTIRCMAYIKNILMRNARQGNKVNLVYEACPKCNRKLPENAADHCNNCHETVTPAARMAFTAILADHHASGQMVRVFNEVAQKLVGLSASRCRELQNEANALEEGADLPRELWEAFEDRPVWRRYIFVLRGRRDTYQGELRSTFQVLNATPATKGLVCAEAMKKCLALLPSCFNQQAVANKRVCSDYEESAAHTKKARIEAES